MLLLSRVAELFKVWMLTADGSHILTVPFTSHEAFDKSFSFSLSSSHVWGVDVPTSEACFEDK
jgi:hypothetical protein